MLEILKKENERKFGDVDPDNEQDSNRLRDKQRSIARKKKNEIR